MGVFGACTKCCALLVLLLAVLAGYLGTQLHPLGIVFSTVFKVQGIGKPGTMPVPSDLMPQPRPEGEFFLELLGGDKMPANGIGMCCRPTAYDPESVRRTVLWYLLQGGRHIDTASVYLNHHAVGQGIKDAMERGVPRSEIFLVTKVFPDHYGYNESIARGRDMVKELGVEYVDLVLMHMPITISVGATLSFFKSKFFGGNVSVSLSSEPEQVQYRLDTWRGLSKLKEEGLIRNCGVSNFNIDHIKEIQALNLAPIATNQMQFHPWIPAWMKEIVRYCHDNKIVVTGYFSLGGFDHKDKALGVDTLHDIAKKHGRRPAQILLRWSLQKKVAIIPGTGNHKHMTENLGTFGFSLSDDEVSRLDSMGTLPISKDFIFVEF